MNEDNIGKVAVAPAAVAAGLRSLVSLKESFETFCFLLEILPTFYVQLLHRYSLDKKLQTQTLIRENLYKALL